MGKLMGGLGMCLVLCSANAGFGQDPFVRSNDDAPTLIRPTPPIQTEPIIQNVPMQSTSRALSNRPYTRGQKNTHVRATRTPAQEAIYQRALYRAKERTKRIEERKWRNISLLRPHNHRDDYWWNEQILPVWGYTYSR